MKKFSLYILFALVAVMTATFTSCKETDNDEQEYPDWKNTNDTYFDKKYSEVKSYVGTGSTEWKVIRAWNLEESVATHSYDHILVDVQHAGNGSGCPLYTDSVKVHYSGRLLPSKSYPDGYMFDKSWSGEEFNDSTAMPAKFAVSGLVTGFTTALMYMHIGDKWRVYIPYQLGYDSAENPGAAYSTLIFDIELVAYYRANSKASAPARKGAGAGRGEWICE